MSEVAVMICGLFLIGFGLVGRKTAPFSSSGMMALGIVLIAVSGFAMLDGPN